VNLNLICYRSSAGFQLGLRRFPLLAHVGFVIEVEEHGEHEDVLDESDEGDEDGELAWVPDYNEQEMAGEVAELHQLELRDPLFPPQKVLHGAQGGGIVVGIHHRVHQEIDDPQHGAVRAAQKGHEDGHPEDHAAVVVYMQEAHLRVLLP